MIKWIKSLWSMLVTVFRLVVSLFSSILHIFSLLGDFNNYVIAGFSVFPPYALGFIALVFSLVTVYFVIKLIKL